MSLSYKTSSPQPTTSTHVKTKIHTYKIKLSDGTFKNLKADFWHIKKSVRDEYEGHTFYKIFPKGEKPVLTAFNPISIEILK